jgi:hypothetical protein
MSSSRPGVSPVGIAIGVLAIGALLLVVGGFLIAGAIRRSRADAARTV